MQEKKINDDLQSRIDGYIKYLSETMPLYEPNELAQEINKLNPNLKEQLLVESFFEVLRKVPFLSKNFTVKTLRKLCLRLKEHFFPPNDQIYKVIL